MIFTSLRSQVTLIWNLLVTLSPFFSHQLDENVPLEALEKTVSYFATVYPAHLLSEKMDQTTYLCDTARVLSAGADAVTTSASTILALLHVSIMNRLKKGNISNRIMFYEIRM